MSRVPLTSISASGVNIRTQRDAHTIPAGPLQFETSVTTKYDLASKVLPIDHLQTPVAKAFTRRTVSKLGLALEPTLFTPSPKLSGLKRNRSKGRLPSSKRAAHTTDGRKAEWTDAKMNAFFRDENGHPPLSFSFSISHLFTQGVSCQFAYD